MTDKLEMPLEQFAVAASQENGRLLARIEQLTSGPGGIMEMKQTIADLEAEVDRLKKKCDIQAMILRRLTPDKYPDVYFVHTGLGKKDENGMPEKLLVCPAYGLDFSYVYEYTGFTMGCEW